MLWREDFLSVAGQYYVAKDRSILAGAIVVGTRARATEKIFCKCTRHVVATSQPRLSIRTLTWPHPTMVARADFALASLIDNISKGTAPRP